MRIKSRLDRLESSHGAFSDVKELIRQGTFYDGLTDEQRQRYAAFKGVTTVQAIEDVELAVNGTLCFPLERNKTADSITKTTSEIEKAIFL